MSGIRLLLEIIYVKKCSTTRIIMSIKLSVKIVKYDPARLLFFKVIKRKAQTVFWINCFRKLLR